MEKNVSTRRLNFGCGYDKREGYVNVDSDPACELDVLLLNNDLSPLLGEPCEEILALDVLEHIPRVQTLGVLLDWAELLGDGGRLVIKTSSIEGVAQQLAADSSFREQYGWTLWLFGSQAHPGDFHLTGFTDTTLRVHLLAAGFDVERIWLADKWLLHAEAVKSSSWSLPATELADLSDEDFVRAVHLDALGREVDDNGLEFLVEELSSGRWNRQQAIRHLMSGPERLFVTSIRHGHESAPQPSVISRIAHGAPEPLRPALRVAGRTARLLKSKAQRAAGLRRASTAS
jgi:predicted SAM-dependent methyltransferase